MATYNGNSRFITSSDTVVTVGPIGDFYVLTDAVDFTNTVAGSNINEIVLDSGTFQISTTQDLRGDLKFTGAGADFTIIEQTNNAVAVFTDANVVGTGVIQFEGVAIKGGTTGLDFSSSFTDAAVNETIFIDQIDDGLVVDGANSFTIDNSKIYASMATTTSGITITGGTIAVVKDTSILNTSGTLASAIYVTASSVLDLQDSVVENTTGTSIAKAVNIDQAIVTMKSSNKFKGATTGIYLSDNVATQVVGNGPEITNSITFDIEFQSGDASVAKLAVNAGRWDDTKVSGQPNGFRSVNNGLQEGRESYNVATDFDVGKQVRGRNTYFGQGRPAVDFMKALTNTNDEAGTWVDVTANLADVSSGIVTLFPGTGVNNTFYIGGTKQAISGFSMQITAAMVIGAGAISVQYWDGAAWQNVTYSTHKSFPSYTRYRTSLFTPGATPEIVDMRFNAPDIYNNMASKSLNSITAFWIRFIITSAITTSPAAQWAQLHGNSTRVTTDGTVQYFSRARMLHRGFVDLNTPDATTPATTADTAISANVSISEYNTHPDGTTTSVLGEYLIQSEDDVATSVAPILRWKPTTGAAGNVVWKITAVPIIMTGATTDTEGALTEQVSTKTTASPAVANKIKTTNFDAIDISTLGPGDKIIFKVERLGAAGGDTYGASVIRRGFHLDIYKAYEGEFS